MKWAKQGAHRTASEQRACACIYVALGGHCEHLSGEDRIVPLTAEEHIAVMMLLGPARLPIV